MGVPKFFRYISERYPCLSEVVKEYQIPEFDHLYLDMNGIIHTCSHPDDGDPHFRITEEKIFQDIFHYIEVLFRMIKPRKLFFMAVDGVAPRAKMNQQRGRRFRSAKEAQTLEAKARERGEVLPTEARFDSNCITPGTVFMTRLNEQLKYFVVNKISTDKLWQNCKIVLSGHETPGEGEHKIMDYIRYMRAQPGYDPNTRHCLYGLDADLIMLGLCTHEPHFSLLREEVKFGKKSNKRKNIPEQITFFLLHLSLMREYLELEFQPLKDSLTFEYDMDKIVDDWVLMGFLVGNDFIPHLPNMHITNGALPILYNAYMKALPKLGGYINEGGTLNLERFETFIQELGSIDVDNFTEKYADLKWFEGKTGRRFNDKSKSPIKARKLEVWEPEGDAVPDEPLEPLQINSELAALIKATDDILLEPSASEQNHTMDVDELEEAGESDIDSDVSVTEEEDLFTAEFLQHKTDYYMNKLEYENVTPEVLRSQAEEYVRAIQWNLHYYYNGVCSWGWYYPHHYAPYVSDVKGFSDLKLQFELGTPFKPYEQLLAVLPAGSKSLLPEPYQELMVNEGSLIKDYYPEDFKTDLNGKRQEWEAVVLIPFIEEDVLLKAMATCSDRLTSEERERNRHGPMLVYEYSPEDLGEYEPPQYFPAIASSHAKCDHVAIEDIRIPLEKLVKGAYPGAKFDVYYPGFPTMKHLQYDGCLEKARVKVFEQPSKGENMILQIIEEEVPIDEEPPTADAIAKDLLGGTVHVGWPHLVEALVVSISNREYRYHSAGEKGQYNVEENKGNLASLWNSEKQGILEHYRNRLGVDVGITETLVHVKVMTGRKYMFSPRGRISLEKQWANVTSAYPLQTVVRDISVYEENYVAYKDISSVFPVGSNCFMLGQPGYGVMAEIMDSTETLKEGRVKLSLKKYEEPDLMHVIEMENDIRIRFMNLHVAATKLAISKGLFSRITGSVYIAPGAKTQMAAEDAPKVNIGLNLKFNKRNEEVPGYSRKEGNTWLYSDKSIGLVRSYIQNFPEVFEYLNYNVRNDVFYEEEMFPEKNAKVMLREITTWIKQQPYYSIERQVCGSLVLDPEATQMLEQVVDDYNLNNCKVKQMIIKVRPHLLYKPDLQFGNLMPDPAASFHLYDRVINVRQGYTVPLGYKGTIIGIHKPSSAKENETTYDVLFDQPFTGGLALNCSPNRGYRMPRPAIINISYGQRVMEQKTGKPGHFLSSSQGQQNHNGPRNNHSNPSLHSSNSGNYPASQFQPQVPGFSNWSHGCNYPVRPPGPPVHNFNQYNYNNYHSTYEGSYSRQIYNNSSYANSPNFNSPGPNTFVPYKSNPFPRSPMISPHYGPPSSMQKNVPNLNSPNSPGGGDVRSLHQGHANGNEVASRSQRDEKREEGKTTILQKVPVPKPDLTILRKSSQVEPTEDQQFSKVNSEFLKKMLKIDESSNDSNASTNLKKPNPIETNKKENSTPLSVEDFFAHARIKEQQQQQSTSQSNYSTARLLKEYQAQNFGCPNYQYFEMNKKVMAKVTLPNGAAVVGEPAESKDEAAENVATKALQMIKGNNAERVNAKPPLDAVPEPPRRWQGTTQAPNQLSPKKTWPKPKEKVVTQENWRTEGKQEKRERIGKIDPGQIHSHLNIDPAVVGATYNLRERGSGAKPEVQKKQKSMTITNSTFVPLQAVRQHRNRTSSSSTSETLAKENNKSKQHAPSKAEKVQVVRPEDNVSTSKTPSKPRRERKMRIAANFQTAMSPQ